MYKKADRIITDKENLSNYIEGYDAYNSLLLQKLGNQELTRVTYTITTHAYRPDLIAEDFYGSVSYMGILILQTGLSLSGFSKGMVLSLLPKSTVDAILNSI